MSKQNSIAISINPAKKLKQIINLTFATILILLMSFTIAFAGEPSSFQNQEFKVKGTWVIEDRTDGQYITLSDAFKTKSAPDLKLFASKKNFTEVNGCTS